MTTHLLHCLKLSPQRVVDSSSLHCGYATGKINALHFHPPVTINCSLFVELTSSVSSDDIEEAFESAIHSLSEDKVGLELLWWSYLVVKMEVACKRSATVQSVKVREDKPDTTANYQLYLFSNFWTVHKDVC